MRPAVFREICRRHGALPYAEIAVTHATIGMDCFTNRGKEVEGLWPDQVDAAQGCGVVLGDCTANSMSLNSDLVHVIRAFLEAAANGFADIPACYNRRYFSRMQNALANQVARHGKRKPTVHVATTMVIIAVATNDD